MCDLNSLPWDELLVPVAYQIALHWAHAPWEVVSVAQLSLFETAFGQTQGDSNTIENYEYFAEYLWFFSAAAMAIHYLSLHLQIRQDLWHVILLEDHMSVSNPEFQMCGFTSFREENPKLCIMRHINLWSSMCPLGWNEIMSNPETEAPIEHINARAPIFALIKWLDAEMTSREHLPEYTFSLSIEGFMTEAGDLVKQAVILHVIIAACPQPHLLDSQSPPQPSRFFWDSLSVPYPVSSNFPDSFVKAMKENLERTEAIATAIRAIYIDTAKVSNITVVATNKVFDI
ncbi:hypothetical protein A1F94_000548 [Pyrenophora tritici-repentis]|nr:hypothetical protein A1F94_000548 [Pyrenophora tritici-repentis]